jgi:hypothetical protein
MVRMSAKDAEGKMVRQLSRLWRYVDGQSPVGGGGLQRRSMGWI